MFKGVSYTALRTRRSYRTDLPALCCWKNTVNAHLEVSVLMFEICANTNGRLFYRGRSFMESHFFALVSNRKIVAVYAQSFICPMVGGNFSGEVFSIGIFPFSSDNPQARQTLAYSKRAIAISAHKNSIYKQQLETTKKIA